MNRLDSFDSGSNYKFADKLQRPQFPRSMFDLSHRLATTIQEDGQLIPILSLPTVPGDSFDISVRSLIRVNPQVVPLMSRKRVYIHAFWSAYGDLWHKFPVFMTKQLTGNLELKLPPVNYQSMALSLASETYDPMTFGISAAPIFDDTEDSGVHCVWSYLRMADPHSGLGYGFAQNGKPGDDNFSAATWKTPHCLDVFQYESIFKHYFLNPNYHLDNRNWFPDDEHDFAVDDNGIVISNTDSEHPPVLYGALHYRDFADDYFTAALPFPQRGNSPYLEFTLDKLFDFSKSTNTLQLGITNNAMTHAEGLNTGAAIAGLTSSVTGMTFVSANLPSGASPDPIPSGKTFVDYSNDKLATFFNDSVAGRIQSTITLDTIRDLAIAQTELEKMAFTDGSYSEFGLTFFGLVPKTAVQYKPLYIGGTYQPISFTEVLQTSATATTPLGQMAGHGISANSDGYIGHFESNDYGNIMIIASIMPDTYYTSGIDPKYFKRSQAEMFLPERARLGLQPIYKYELCSHDLYDVSVGHDDDYADLFAYQSPFDRMRYLPNRATGKIGDPFEENFAPYVQQRYFFHRDIPSYGQDFASTRANLDKSYLFAPEEDAYICDFGFDIRAVRPLPYKAEPAQILN